MNNEKQLNILDLITIISFVVGLENLQENREQSEKQEEIINAIETHLQRQDDEYKRIIDLLERM